MTYKEHIGEDQDGNPIFKQYSSKKIFEIELHRDDNGFLGNEKEFVQYVLDQIEEVKALIKYDKSLGDLTCAEIISQIESEFLKNILETNLNEQLQSDDEKLSFPDNLVGYVPFDLNKKNRMGGRPKGRAKRTINRYNKVFHRFTIVQKKYTSKTKTELYELVSTDSYDGKKYSPETIKNIIEEKKYNLKPSQ